MGNPTEAATGAQAQECDVLTASGVVTEFDNFVQHNGDGGNPHSVLSIIINYNISKSESCIRNMISNKAANKSYIHVSQ